MSEIECHELLEAVRWHTLDAICSSQPHLAQVGGRRPPYHNPKVVSGGVAECKWLAAT